VGTPLLMQIHNQNLRLFEACLWPLRKGYRSHRGITARWVTNFEAEQKAFLQQQFQVESRHGREILSAAHS
jgi:hypothetical protein